VAVEQRDHGNRSRIWPQQIELAIGYPDEIRTAGAVLGTPRVEDRAVEGWPRPVFVLPNGGGIAYGRIVLDEDTRRYLLDHLPDVPDALTRGSAWITLWDELLEQHVSPTALFDLALRAVRVESDELNVQRMLDTLDTVFWRFSTAAARGARAAEIERVLQDGLDRAGTQSLKGAWFRALMHVAMTPGAIAWLTHVWRLEVPVPGLILSEPDYTELAQELAVRGVPDAEGILDGQLDRIQNPDRRARFAFVRPALSADRRVRDDFFVSLGNELNRRHEPWVLEALGFLHHPLRAAEAERYVRPSLEMLREIQRTGDIFFPKRWTDATLEGHNSVRVAATVRTFLDEHPDLSPRLRRIVLQSADELFRASTILGM
jgi:aminopeptidase N